MFVQPGGHSDPVRGADRLAADGQPRAAVPGPDQQHAAAPVQLQRDPQPAGGAGHHVRAMHTGAAGDAAPGGRHAGVVAPVRHDHPAGGGAAVQLVFGRQHAAPAPGRLCVRGAPRMRLGLPRLVPAVPVQLVPGQVHPVRRVRSVLLAQQVHIPLAPHRRRGPVRATGRGQLQLVAQAHEAQRRPARSRGARVGGRQGHVQRRHAKTGRVQQTVTAVAAPTATAPTATAVATATSAAAFARATTVVGFVVAAVVRFVGRRRNRANAPARAPVGGGSSAPSPAPSTPPPTPVAGTAAKEIGAGRTGAGAVHAAAPGHGRLRVATAGQPVRRGRGRRGCVLGGRRFALLAAQTRVGPTSSQRHGQPGRRRGRLFFRFPAGLSGHRGRGRSCRSRSRRRRRGQVGRRRRRRLRRRRGRRRRRWRWRLLCGRHGRRR